MMNHKPGTYYYDDGRELDPHAVPIPDLCTSCRHYNASKVEHDILCTLTRADEQEEDIFLCFAYEPASEEVDRETVLRALCARAGIDFPEHLP